jgi:hypothetical protein
MIAGSLFEDQSGEIVTSFMSERIFDLIRNIIGVVLKGAIGDVVAY